MKDLCYGDINVKHLGSREIRSSSPDPELSFPHSILSSSRKVRGISGVVSRYSSHLGQNREGSVDGRSEDTEGCRGPNYARKREKRVQ